MSLKTRPLPGTDVPTHGCRLTSYPEGLTVSPKKDSFFPQRHSGQIPKKTHRASVPMFTLRCFVTGDAPFPPCGALLSSRGLRLAEESRGHTSIRVAAEGLAC